MSSSVTKASNPSVQYTNLSLRDGQQSTLDSKDWVLDTSKMAQVLAATLNAQFQGAEIAGGQSFQTAISNGFNPFTLVDSLSNAIRSTHADKSFDFQMLFRGANALGFRHYDKEVVEATLNEFIKNGITKIRFFDALNDIDNLFLPDSVKKHTGVILQGAICFGHYKQASDRYTDDYYVSYVQRLLEKGFNSIAIKDMSGQMTPERMKHLLPKIQEVLQPMHIPLDLHLHSTNETVSQIAIQQAVQLGLNSIETVEGPLAGGSSHHSLDACIELASQDSQAYQQLQKVSRSVWSAQPSRKDTLIPADLKEKLCAAGVPGGAMPFVIHDLKTQSPTIIAKYKELRRAKLAVTQKFSISKINQVTVSQSSEDMGFDQVVELFIAELKRVCCDAAFPLLVTPTADICAKQAIVNLAFGGNPYSEKLEDRYLNANGTTGADPRFAKLILGHYGEFKSYLKDDEIFQPAQEVISFFEKYNPHDLKKVTQHPSSNMRGSDMSEARAAAWGLIHREGSKALSFANFDQLSLMYALKPSSAPGVDPIANAVKAYAKRAIKIRINGQGITFPGYETIMQPIVDHLGAMLAVNHSIKEADIMKIKLGDFGKNLYRKLFRTYATLPITQEVTRVSNTLMNLVSSDHTNNKLKTAVDLVGQSFRNLDFRPQSQTEESYVEARESFKEKTLSDLFNSLALTHSLVNSVDKHGTNPKLPAERAITLEDVRLSTVQPVSRTASEWEKRLSASIKSRHFLVEADLKRRVKEWRS